MGDLPLEQVKTVEVERWLRATGVADGTKAKIKCVMSALFSHAVRSAVHADPISSGIPVGTGGRRTQRWRSDQARNIAEIPPWFCHRSRSSSGWQNWSFGISSSCSRGGLGYTSRRTGGTLAVLRFREHEHQRPPLVLLASRWKPEEHKDGSVCKTAADASKPKAFLAGVEITKPLQQTGRFRFPFRTTARHQAARSSFSPEEENTARIQTDRNHGCGLAHVSALIRDQSWRRSASAEPANPPDCLPAQQPSCHEQIPAGDIEDQTVARHRTNWSTLFCRQVFAGGQPDPMNAVL